MTLDSAQYQRSAAPTGSGPMTQVMGRQWIVSAGHPLAGLENVVLASHSAFRTPEATDNLIEASLEHCRRILRDGA